MLNVFVHGSGDCKPGFSESFGPEKIKITPKSIREFLYEDNIDATKVSKVLLFLSKLYQARIKKINLSYPIDFVQDIVIFLFNKDVRDSIEYEFIKLIETNNCRIFAHSLGALVAQYILAKNPRIAQRCELITFGNPYGAKLFLGKVIQSQMKKICPEKLNVKSWDNIVSWVDPLSGKIDQAKNYTASTILHNQKSRYLEFWYDNTPDSV